MNPRRRLELKIAICSLLLGAIGAPLFYVALAIIAPQGFANLRGEGLLVAPVYLLIGWLWSAVFTLAIGGIAWLLLHMKGWDGFVSYAITAGLVALVLAFVLSAELPNWILPVMAVLNGLAVRFAELRLRARWDGSNPSKPGASSAAT